MNKSHSFNISGNLVDVITKTIFPATITVHNGKITEIKRDTENKYQQYILPGFIDSHIHVESSMLIPSQFARLAAVHGTVATVSDPHEIANVLGAEGVRYMIANGKKVPFKFFFGAPSCVPATNFETSGASLGIKETDELLKSDDVKYLAEMMNFPGVLFGDKEVMGKINAAKKYHKVIDGHAPNVRNEDAAKYAAAGISTDHECFSLEEAYDKIKYGMKVQIREGSAAKNFEDLADLLNSHPESVMLCSDDKHPDDLVNGHINLMMKRAVAKNIDIFNALRSVTYIPVKHYGLNVGLLQTGDDADFITVDNLKDFNVHATYIKGEKVAENGKSMMPVVLETPVNIFNADKISVADLYVRPEYGKIRVIEALEGQLITNEILDYKKVENNNLVSDTSRDNLKLTVINRYQNSKPAIGFIRNFGFKKGAIASTVAHDSHNIIAVGVSDEDIADAVNLVIENKGGISVCCGNDKMILPLPVAGLMSNSDCYEVAALYEQINNKVKQLGSKLHAPYMTLSFMALLVIPKLKLSDQGLFDGNNFKFTNLFVK